MKMVGRLHTQVPPISSKVSVCAAEFCLWSQSFDTTQKWFPGSGWGTDVSEIHLSNSLLACYRSAICLLRRFVISTSNKCFIQDMGIVAEKYTTPQPKLEYIV